MLSSRNSFLEMEMDLKQIELYRLMSPSQKLRIALRLYYSAWQLKEAGLRLHHPDWTEKELQEKTKEIFLYART
jgi:hypothetical protein